MNTQIIVEKMLLDERYQILQKLGEGCMSVVYSANDLIAKKVIVIKFLHPGITSSYVEDIIRFKKEMQTVQKFQHPHIVQLFTVGEFNQLPYLVMEYLEGDNLENILMSEEKIDSKTALKIITQIGAALLYSHNQNIIHRDLNPGNIILAKQDSTGFSTKLLDFGLSQIMELSQIKNKKEIVGTFGYMSPEQSGVIKKVVDERSDLYSLGIILYQLTVGSMPFCGNTINELLHHQIAHSPVLPRKINPDIPEIIEAIILKLLKKEPEDRYQTVAGFLADITRVTKGEVAFSLAKNDYYKKLTYQTSLINRDEELKTLQHLYDLVKGGNGNICFISGEAGRGKSRLINELRGYVYANNGDFIYGKCFDQLNKTPYQSFQECLNDYIAILNSLPIAEKEKRIEHIQKIIGDFGDVICKLNSNMKTILPDAPSLVKLDHERENRRFLMACANFFKLLGEKNKPVVLVLDDLHWADEGDILLLTEIMDEIADYPLFILGTYRDNEIDSSHSLSQVIENARQAKQSFTEIQLSNFNEQAIGLFIQELLNYPIEREARLVSYIFDKTKGNPLFIAALLRQLIDEKILLFHDEKLWMIDEEKLKNIPIATTIIDVLLKRVEKLNSSQAQVLSIAAVFGKNFKLNFLREFSNFSMEELISLVDKLVEMQLLEKGVEKGQFVFFHERIKDTFYSRISEKDKQKAHLKIAHILEAAYREDKDIEFFEIAYHFTQANDLEKSLLYSLPAAKEAQARYVNEEAIRYYKITIQILEKTERKKDSRWVEATQGLMEVYLTIGNCKEAIAMGQQLLPLKDEKLEKAQIYKSIGQAYFKMGEWTNCENTLINGMSLLGENIPRGPLQVKLSLGYEIIMHIIYSFFPGLFKYRGKGDNQVYKHIIWLYLRLDWVYILSNTTKFLRSQLRMLRLAESKVGVSKELGMAIGAYASLCMAIPLFKRALRYHDKGFLMRQAVNDEWGIPQSLQWLGFCYSWKGEREVSITTFQKAREGFEKIGDCWELGMVMMGISHNYHYLGDYHKAIEYTLKQLELSKKNQDSYGIALAYSDLSHHHAELGNFEEAEKWAQEGFAIAKVSDNEYMYCRHLIKRGYIQIEQQNYEKAQPFLKEAYELYNRNNFLGEYTVFILSYLNEIEVEQYKKDFLNLSFKERRKRLNLIRRSCAKAIKKAKPWPNHIGRAFRIMAQCYLLSQQWKKADNYFNKSICACRNSQYKYDLAKTLFVYGNALQSQNKKETAKIYHEQSYSVFTEIKAKKYIAIAADTLGINAQEQDTQEITTQDRLRFERKMSIAIDSGRYLSSILDLTELLNKIMDKAMELVGAQRGVLALYSSEKENQLNIEIARNINQEEFAEIIDKNNTIIGKVTLEAKAIIVADPVKKLSKAADETTEKSILCAPILSRRKVIGIIYLDNHLISDLFREEDLKVLTLIASQAGISIDNAHLYQKVEAHSKNLEILVAERTEELKKTQSKLLELAHQMGRAEVSASVLHNIGNAVTPLVAKVCGLAAQINNKDFLFLDKLNSLIDSINLYSKDTIADFFIKDEKGKKFPEFIKLLAKFLEKQQKLLQASTNGMLMNIDHIDEIIRTEMNYAGGGQEKHRIFFEEFVQNAILMQEFIIKEKGISINYDLEPNLYVFANKTKFMQVLQNVIKNAYEAIEKNTTNSKKAITITTKYHADTKFVDILIKDTGIGIATDKLEGIFEKGYTTKKESLGLGLFSAKEYVQSCEGSLIILSEGQNMGSTVKIVMPGEPGN